MLRTGLLSVVLGLALSTGGSAFAQGPISVRPGAQSFELGAMKVSVVRAGELAIPNDGSVFGSKRSAAQISTLLRAAGRPTEKIYLDIDVLLIRTDGRTILIDTGYGPEHKSVLGQSLASLGVSPLEVTDILVTHAHPDHVGGLIDAAGHPAFPRATIRMSADEWRFMQDQTETKDISEAVRGQVQTFVPGGEVLPHIVSIAFPGHTPGHVMYELSSNGKRMLDLGDTVHSSIVSLRRPDLPLAWDWDQALGERQRTVELQTLAHSAERMFAVHFPFPGVGFIEHKKHGFAFVPSLPRPSDN